MEEPEAEETQEAAMTEDGAPESAESESSAFIPAAILGGKQFRPGDTITLKVVESSDDGLEVAVASAAPAEASSDYPSAESEIDAAAAPM